MPCTYYEGPEEARERHEKDFTHNSKIADLLCGVMQGLESHGNMQAVLQSLTSKQHKQLLDWWDEHKARDRKRVLAELADAQKKKEYNEALAKLTPHERRLLGL